MNGSVSDVAGLLSTLTVLLFGAVLLSLDKERHATRNRYPVPSVHTQAQTSQKQTDIALLHRVAAKDSSALSDLYDRYSSLLFTILIRIVRNEKEAEDLLQEIFVRVWEKAGSFNETLGPPSVWLSRIARNLAIDRLRSGIFRTREKEEDLDNHFQLQDGGDGPDQAAIQSQQRTEVAEALAALPPEQRELIECAYFQGYTQSELAEHFGIPLGTVKTRIRAGMSALRTRLHHLV